tara:strand:+ start:6379 stop:7665 length:1287 start_codon:yes stop_codon:yes gene_type:complete
MPIIEWDEYTGRLAPIDAVEIRARVSGYLQSTHFDEGHLIKEGDLLAIIDPRPFVAEMNAAAARLEEAKAILSESKSLLKQSQAEKADSVALLTLAEQRVKRVHQLVRKDAITQEEVEVRESEQLQAKATLEAANAKIESSNARIATSTAAIETAKANLEAAQLNVQYTQVRAPISGRISRRYVTEGNLISGGSEQSTLLTTIVSVNPIHCYFDADEQAFLKYARLSREGTRESSRDVKNPVYMRLIDESGFPHLGHMDFVDNRIDPNTGTMRGRAIFPNDDDTLTPGLFAEVRLPGSGRYNAILIPDSAISSDQTEKFVYLLDNNKKVERRPVELGPIVKGLRIIRSGLDGSEILVTHGLQRIYPGVTVEPTLEVVKASSDVGLPDRYEPVPPDKWLSRRSSPAPPGISSNNNQTKAKTAASQAGGQ